MRVRWFWCCFALAACQRSQVEQVSAPASAAVASSAPAASAAPPQDPAIAAALATLRREEDELRARTDFATVPPSSRSFGANPYALVALPASARARPSEPAAAYAALLRGDSRVVLLDARLSELGSAKTALSPVALTVAPGGDGVLVVSPYEAAIQRYHVESGSLDASSALPLPTDAQLRALAADERVVVAADFTGDRWFAAPAASLAVRRGERVFHAEPTCRGPFRVALTRGWLGVACLFDRAIALHRRDARGLPGPETARIQHDGPIWGFSLLEDAGALLVGAGGVEDRPLERRDKVFGYVDSFAYVYRVAANAAVTRALALNVSELGVVTPKVARLERRAGKLWFTLLGYGSDRWVELALEEGAPGAPRSVVHAGVPGCADASFAGARPFCANPLFDAWVELSEPPLVHAVRPPDASDPPWRDRLGEALFFTTLMAPDASSAGRLSRFTCETCHFEGGSDGRVHYSGRAAIRVSTRPLFGLLNAAPHFSRAHDPDLTSVSHNEFSVANRGNPVDPWFALEPSRFPWLGELGVPAETLDPLALRRALLAFLGRFTHAENPAALARGEARFSAGERRGAELFREQCVRCHAARLIANDPKSEVGFERWEKLVLSPEGPLVWSTGLYEKAGVEPYVERRGTRVPSLRRLYEKRPYLTNGSARSLADVLAVARFTPALFVHGGPAPDGARAFDDGERSALLAFLRLL
jgi:hypothetical protein